MSFFEPKTALNIVAFPKDMDTAILGEILKGGADKVMEAGAVLAGVPGPTFAAHPQLGASFVRYTFSILLNFLSVLTLSIYDNINLPFSPCLFLTEKRKKTALAEFISCQDSSG